MQKVKAALLGLQHPHSRAHLSTLQQLPEVESIALWDPNAEALAELAIGDRVLAGLGAARAGGEIGVRRRGVGIRVVDGEHPLAGGPAAGDADDHGEVAAHPGRIDRAVRREDLGQDRAQIGADHVLEGADAEPRRGRGRDRRGWWRDARRN